MVDGEHDAVVNNKVTCGVAMIVFIPHSKRVDWSDEAMVQV